MAAPLTVLFVEDDTLVRNAVVQMLSDRVFRVLVAADGYDAARLLAANHVDLLFTDIIMPGMDGVQLAKQARAMRPRIKVLFTTGYAQRAMQLEALHYGKVLFKPMRQTELLRELDALMATR